MKMSGGSAMSAEGDVDYQGSNPEMQMTMKMPQMGAGTMEMRFVDGIVYMTMPQVTPRGKFLKIDPNDKSNPMSQNFGSLTEQMDPLNSIKGMRAGVQDVEFVGAEEVAGRTGRPLPRDRGHRQDDGGDRAEDRARDARDADLRHVAGRQGPAPTDAVRPVRREDGHADVPLG